LAVFQGANEVPLSESYGPNFDRNKTHAISETGH
jgi:hypothetical protein